MIPWTDRNIGEGETYGRRDSPKPELFPLCQLHGTRVVFEFPASCPHGADDPHEMLQATLDEAASISIRDIEQMQTRETLFAVHKICSNCVLSNAIGPHGKWLRSRLHGAMNDTA